MGDQTLEYGKIKVGKKVLEDVVLNLNANAENINNSYRNKNKVLKALINKDVIELRKISNYFYRTSGIYFRLCNYFAQMYRYDWYIVDEIYDEKVDKKKVIKEFYKALNFLDNSYIRKTCMDIALQVILNGAYYGCIIPNKTGIIFQELPVNYCRSRYKVGNIPIIELNMKYFDDKFTDTNYRQRVLKMLPEDIQKGYTLYKKHKY